MESTTISAVTMMDCNQLSEDIPHNFDTLATQNHLGCNIVKLLQFMYGFNISYIFRGAHPGISLSERRQAAHPMENDTADVFVRPMVLWSGLLNTAYPIQDVHIFSVAFILRQENYYLGSFYRQPFSPRVWQLMFFMMALAAMIFYWLSRSEKRMCNGLTECSLWKEFLVAVSACCQHSLDLMPILTSRRIAYFSYFLYSYILYVFYSSNLLSFLMSEREISMELEELAASDYECIVQEDYQTSLTSSVLPTHVEEFKQKKLLNANIVNISQGVKAVKSGRVAFLTDVYAARGEITSAFNKNEICNIVVIDILKGSRRVMVTSKHFKYKEQFKIGTMRAKEAGILNRMLQIEMDPMLCETPQHVLISIQHVFSPFVFLAAAYVLALLLLFGELIYHEHYQLWPYLD